MTSASTHEAAILVAGATGFIGKALVEQLRAEGRRVIVWARNPVQARTVLGPKVQVVEQLHDLAPDTTMHGVVNLAGAPVLGTPWTSARRRLLLSSRVDTTAALVTWMRTLAAPPHVLVSASAVGYYGVPAQSTVPLDETAPAQPGRFQSDLCAAVEREACRAEALGVRVVRLRFGIVLGHDGGAYPALALAARFGLGAVLGGGSQPMPWIHRHDAIGLIGFALDNAALHGAVNAVAPEVVSQAGFTDALARSLGRPRWLAVPGWPLRGVLREMSELLLDGQNVRPAAALAAGYGFVHPTLGSALQELKRA